eukprot:Tbor_TRINITY_DN6176_c1_g1::TRINITY_DN6176_c1_g1_i6::g.22388::m.22388
MARMLIKVGEAQTTSQEIMTRQMAESDERRTWPFLATIIPIEKELKLMEEELKDLPKIFGKQREAFDMRIEAKNLSAYDTLCLNYLTSGDSKDIFRLIYLILNKNTCEERINFHNVLTLANNFSCSRIVF